MPTATETTQHKVVSPAEWLAARKEFLVKEKEFTRLRDELSQQRRELPWERVEKPYEFEGPEGQVSLSDLFTNHSQLVIYHFMLGPGWSEGCKSCSYLADHFDGMTIHLAHRDVNFAVVSHAPFAEITAFKQRMGWHFPWYSSFGSDFNYDYQVSLRPEERGNAKVYYNYRMVEFGSDERPGLSVFFKDEHGEIFHTYSSYERGLDILVGAYNFLDMVPKGRDEAGLKHSMAWLRHHDRYDDNYKVDAMQPYTPPEIIQTKSAAASCCSDKK
jgi:predicted dithiol-disulfide oxidoreductase (DUF899 family)